MLCFARISNKYINALSKIVRKHLYLNKSMLMISQICNGKGSKFMWIGCGLVWSFQFSVNKFVFCTYKTFIQGNFPFVYVVSEFIFLLAWLQLRFYSLSHTFPCSTLEKTMQWQLAMANPAPHYWLCKIYIVNVNEKPSRQVDVDSTKQRNLSLACDLNLNLNSNS